MTKEAAINWWNGLTTSNKWDIYHMVKRLKTTNSKVEYGSPMELSDEQIEALYLIVQVGSSKVSLF